MELNQHLSIKALAECRGFSLEAWLGSLCEKPRSQRAYLNATVRRNPSGKYFVSLLVETEMQALAKTNSSCGVDVGLKDFAILSTGTVYKNLKFFRTLEKKLAKEQRILARRKEGAMKRKCKLSEAKNYQKQKVKVARIHEIFS